MSIFALIVAFIILLLLGFLMFFAFWYFLPVFLFIGILWWIYSLFRKPKRKKTTYYFYTNLNPDSFQNPKQPDSSSSEAPMLRAPLEDSIDAEYTETPEEEHADQR